MCEHAHGSEFIYKAYRHCVEVLGSFYWQEYIFIATFPWHSHQKSFYILLYHWQCLYTILISEKIKRKGNGNIHVLDFQNVGHFTGSFIKTECELCEISSFAFCKVRLRGEKQLDLDLLCSTHTLPPLRVHTNTSLVLKTICFPKDRSQRRSISFFL